MKHIMPRVCVCFIAVLLLLVRPGASAQSNWFAFDSIPALQQYAPYTCIYKIPTDSVYSIAFQQHKITLGDAWLKTPLFKVPFGARTLDSLLNDKHTSTGYYLLVSMNGMASINYYVRRVQGFNVAISNLRHVMLLTINDTAHKPVCNALVMLRNRQVPYDSLMGGYVAGGFKNGDVLSVRKGDDIMFFDCLSEKNAEFEQPERENPTSAQNERSHTYNGYMVTNKPVYKPGDTVKFKAYLEYPENNKPAKEPVEVTLKTLNSYPESEIKIFNKLLPQAPGVYFSEFVLDDSIKTDRQYQLAIDGTRYDYSITGQFKTEDYLLDEIHLKVTGERYRMYQHGDSIHLYAAAFDANNLPVADGKLEISVTSQEFGVITDKPVFIPDTLFHYQADVNASGETYLGFATKNFPDARMTLLCRVTLTNSNFERKDTSFIINYTNAATYVDVSEAGNMVRAQLISNKQPVTGTGTFQQWGYYNSDVKNITYPFEYAIQETDQMVTFRVNDNTASRDPDVHFIAEAQIEEGMEDFVQDTAYLLLRDPQHIQYRYSMYAGNNFIGYGSVSRDTLIKVYSPQGKTVTILGYYTWKGRTQEKRFEIYKLDRNMIISMDKKDFVYPGQKDTIRIHLTDKDRKAIDKTNVTVLAFNSQFKEDYVPELPYGGLLNLPLGEPRYFKNIVAKEMQFLNTDVANLQTLSLCGADTLFFYKNLFLLPQKYAWLVYNLPFETGTQAAFFLRQGGSYVQPEIIYVDGEPVYFRQANSVSVNSFFMSPGIHQVSLRTRNAKYNIRDLEVCAHTKTSLFLNLDSITYVRPGYDTLRKAYPFITIDSLADTLAMAERDVIARHMLLYRGEHGYSPLFIQHRRQIKTASPMGNTLWSRGREPYDKYRVALIGPFANMYDSMTFYEYNNTKLRFMPELGYIFTFRQGMTRVEKQSVYDYLDVRLADNTMWPDYSFVQQEPIPFDSLVVSVTKYVAPKPKVIPAPQPAKPKATKLVVAKPKTKYLFRQAKNIALDGAFARVLIRKADSAVRVIALHRKSDTAKPFVWEYLYDRQRVNAGNYEVFIVWSNGYCDKEDATLQANGITAIVLQYKGKGGKFNYAAAPGWLKGSIFMTNPEPDAPQYSIVARSRDWDGSGEIAGTVLDNKKEPIINAIVQVFAGGVLKGTGVTDYDGNYSIRPLDPGEYKVVIKAGGFRESHITNVIIAENKTTNLNLVLDQQSNSLQEVRVVAYKTPLVDPYEAGSSGHLDREEIEKSPVLTTDELVSLSPGVYQSSRQNGDLNIGGSRSEGSLYIIDGVQVRGTFGTSQDRQNTAAYKDDEISSAKGKLLLSSGKSKSFINNFLNSPMAAAGLRRNFRDWAIWEPNLWTNSDGNTSFTVTYPDNITSWKTYVLAMNSKGYAGKLLQMTRAFKPLGASLSAPRFLRYGDTVEVVGKVMNYTDRAFDLKTTFAQNGNVIDTGSATVHNTQVQKLIATAPAANRIDTAELSLAFTMTTAGGYNDGEERVLPVLPVGTIETKGDFVRMIKDTTFTTKPDTSAGHFTGKTNICIDGSLLEVMLREIEHLKVYPHGCSEQLTTKLLSVYYEEEVKRVLHIAELNNTKEKKEILEQLVRAQNRDGSFPWWPGGSTTDPRITNYVLSTMQKINKDHWLDYIIRRGLDCLNANLGSMNDEDRIASLATLSQASYAANYKQYLDKAKTGYLDRYNRFAIVKIKKEQGLEYRKDLDTLVQEATETETGLYWQRSGYDWYRNDIATTLLAYSVVLNDSVYAPQADKVISYLLLKRRDGYYQNTAESGLVISTLLPGLLKGVDVKHIPEETTVEVKGTVHDTVRHFPKFYEVKDGNPQFSFVKKGISPVFVSVAYNYFNPAPVADSTAFVVHSVFVHNGDTVSDLKQGEKVMMQVTVRPKKDAEYVMIEIPIPAGCVQVNKQPYNYWQAGRENFKDRTVIFCSALSKNTYTFSVELEARYKGRYTINPARASMMYFPKEYGNTELKKVSVK